MINDDAYLVANNLPLVRRAGEGVLANDSDPNGGLFIPDDGWFATTEGGAIYLEADGSFAYLAPTGFFGTDTFVYTAENGIGSLANATITFEVVAAANQPAIRMADSSLIGAVLAPGQSTLPLTAFGAGIPVALAGGGYVVAGSTSEGEDSHGFIQAYGPDGSPVGGLFDIHADNGVHNVTAVATDGGYVVAWREGGHASDEWPVQFQVFDLAGNPVGTTRALFDGVDLNGTPVIFTLAGGNLAVSILLAGGGTIAQIIEPDGDPVGGTFALVSTPGPVAVIADNLGGFFQLWRDDPGDGTRLWVQRLAADGTPIGPEIGVVEGVQEGVGGNLAMSADGSLVVTWTEYDSSPTVANVHARVFAPDGAPVGAEFVSTDFFASSLFGAPTLQKPFALANGGFVVAWERDVEPWSSAALELGEARGGTRAISAVVFDAQGNVLSDEILVYTVDSQTPLGAGRLPARVVALPDGGFAIVAQEYVGGVDPDMNVRLHSFDALGNRVGDDALINGSAAGYQANPFLAVLSDGRLVGTWTGATDTEGFVGSQILNLVNLVEREEDQGPITIPLAVDVIRSFGPDSAVRIVIEGLPEGSVLTPPPGVTATFDQGSELWTLAGAIPEEFNLTLALPQYFWGDVTILATVYARDDEGTAEVASTPLAIRLSVAPDAAVIIGTPGNDTVNGEVSVAGQDFAGPLGDVIRGLAGRDALSGLAGDDVIHGGKGGDTLDGGAGDDTLLANRGRDTLQGGEDDDVLLGGRNRDTLDGGAGDDWLNGGRGRDRLTGGEGMDTFVLGNPGRPELIADFADGDIIALESSAFEGIGLAGPLEANRFHVGAEAETKQQKILYDSGTGWLLYAKQGSETPSPVKFAKIGKDLADFGASDVMVI